MADVSVESQRSLGYRVLAHSREPEVLDRIRNAVRPSWDVTSSVTVTATFEELRSRHFDVLVTDEPALILVLHDRFPTVEMRARFAEIYFKSEYAYIEFLREYRERHGELSAIRTPEIPTILIRRYSDPMRLQLYPEGSRLATREIRAGSPEEIGLVGRVLEEILRTAGADPAAGPPPV